MAVLTGNRRLSVVPFGPDDYDAFNPAIRGDNISPGPQYSTPDGDNSSHVSQNDDKIITYDGREVDPSDHLPPDTYAPEPAKKGPKYGGQGPEESSMRSRSRGPPSTGRRQLRQAGRPQSMSAATPVYIHSHSDPSIPVTMSRNRLQKKANRMSGAPPIDPYQDNFQARGPPPRSHMSSFSDESYAPGYRGNGGPPVSFKQPMVGGATNTDAWALLDEMKNIDLGVGRSRRKR